MLNFYFTLGVNTADILTAYISAIRALRMLDPSGVLLELVCDPVRKYLRSADIRQKIKYMFLRHFKNMLWEGSCLCFIFLNSC